MGGVRIEPSPAWLPSPCSVSCPRLLLPSSCCLRLSVPEVALLVFSGCAWALGSNWSSEVPQCLLASHLISVIDLSSPSGRAVRARAWTIFPDCQCHLVYSASQGGSACHYVCHRIVQGKQERQQKGLVGVPAFWGHRSLCESSDIYGASLQKMHMRESHKTNIVHETFTMKPPPQEF